VENLLARLAEIGEKADYLNQKSQALVQENRSLHSRIQELERKIVQQQMELKEQAEQHELIKLAKRVEHRDEAATEELKKKINEYIREIDQCLKLIGD
jgi:response regulator RpfG family c-di-GMP phosphodiesterase